MSGLPISIFDLDCNTDTPDANGVTWSCTMDGWSNSDIQSGSLDPTGRHGLSLLQQWRRGKPMQFTGLAKAASESDAWDGYYAFAAMFDVNTDGDVVAQEPTPKQIRARISASPLISTPRGTGQSWTMRWDVQLVAEFPYKTALTPTTTPLAASASTTLTNNGTAAAYPVVTTTSIGTVDLVIGGRHFTTASVASGVVIDMWARTLVDGSGDPVYAAKTPESEWLSLPRGGTSVTNAGTAALSIAHYHTYN